MEVVACNKAEPNSIVDGLVEYNSVQVPFAQTEPFISLDYKIEEAGSIVAGVLGCLYCWGCLHISVLFVEDKCRGRGYGSKLLEKIESEAKRRHCNIIHLDTFSFQAKDFYLKRGYTVFGALENCPKGHARFYLKKEI